MRRPDDSEAVFVPRGEHGFVPSGPRNMARVLHEAAAVWVPALAGVWLAVARRQGGAAGRWDE
ncbi:hypothetical protein [Chitinasiproducens palmae]|uniref:hypothetical protein n=1 Tax=Chitinasiproducens palmae TaxID=1770053 RepID=UPI001113EA54|nr:hypothetical protein [Chitinasiproducens palmae]